MSDRIALSMSHAHPALSVAELGGSQLDEQMDAAREKADQTMESAATGLWLGVVTGVVAAGTGAASSTAAAQGGHAESTSGAIGGLARMVPPGGLHAGVVSDIERDAVSKKAEEEESQASAAKNHTSRVRDAIADLLQKIGQMNSSSKLLG